MKTDLYTKVVLTVIALALLGIAARPLVDPTIVKAQQDAINYTNEFRSMYYAIDGIRRTMERIERNGLTMRQVRPAANPNARPRPNPTTTPDPEPVPPAGALPPNES